MMFFALLLQAGSEPPPLPVRARQFFAPLPARMDAPGLSPQPAQIELGRKLFYETQLSFNNTQSCNTCHDLMAYGQDGRPTSPGAVRGRGKRNAPSVYTAALHKAQFWDGRSSSVEDQARFPILNEIEMGMPSETLVEQRLRAVPEYRRLFARAYPHDLEPVRWERVLQAIGAFERGLLAPAPFDRYLQGEVAALDASQARGLEHFLRVGCVQCHQGPALGGDRLQKIGQRRPFPCDDRGRAEATGQAQDEGVFKVPSLRNVSETGPYYHHGQVRRLEEAVQLMGQHELDVELTPQEVMEICDFLLSLKGQIPTDYVKPP
jgi:cytochrome c peroxidase